MSQPMPGRGEEEADTNPNPVREDGREPQPRHDEGGRDQPAKPEVPPGITDSERDPP